MVLNPNLADLIADAATKVALKKFYRTQPLAKPASRQTVKRRKKRAEQTHVRGLRAVLVAKTQGRCQDCGTYVADLGHAHHVRPRSLGGRWTEQNLRYLCWLCHQRAHRLRVRTLGTRPSLSKETR